MVKCLDIGIHFIPMVILSLKESTIIEIVVFIVRKQASGYIMILMVITKMNIMKVKAIAVKLKELAIELDDAVKEDANRYIQEPDSKAVGYIDQGEIDH